MDKLVIRLVIILVAFYLIICYIGAIIFAINLWRQDYYLLFELCVCLCISKQGVYHCKYLKYTAYAILISDVLVCIANRINIASEYYTAHMTLLIIIIGLLITVTKAIRHYRKVLSVRKKNNDKGA